MTREPGVFLTATWRHLAMLNYEVDPAILEPRVPEGVELDLWEGRCFVTVVGFQFQHTRLLGIPVPWHRSFEEVNLRFYVRRRLGDEVRRGVVFVKEIVPRRAIAWAARVFYDEPYVALPMDHRDTVGPNGGSVAYTWELAGRPQRLAVEVSGEPFLPDEDSEEAFVTEHYWGYTATRGGATQEYRVEHSRWNLWKVEHSQLACDVEALYGPEFVSPLSGPPDSALLADGSDVAVLSPSPISTKGAQ